MANEYRVCDALKGMRDLPSRSVDLIVTDPAYDTLEKWREQGTTTRLSHSKQSSNDWFPVVDMDYLREVIRESFRVLKRNTYLFVMCDYFTSIELHDAAVKVGFDPKKPLIWEKVGKKMPVKCPNCRVQVTHIQGRGSPGMGYPFRSQYEMVYFAQKGKRKPPENKSVRDVLRFQRLKGNDLWPTEKPVPLLELLIKQSSNPGDLVLDPFAGSGSTLVAAAKLGRQYLGFDESIAGQEYFHAREDRVDAPPKPKRRERTSPIFRMFGGSRTKAPRNE
jgi:site-specific DNA-methyltransferase (adenine-specific)